MNQGDGIASELRKLFGIGEIIVRQRIEESREVRKKIENLGEDIDEIIGIVIEVIGSKTEEIEVVVFSFS